LTDYSYYDDDIISFSDNGLCVSLGPPTPSNCTNDGDDVYVFNYTFADI